MGYATVTQLDLMGVLLGRTLLSTAVLEADLSVAAACLAIIQSLCQG